MKEDKIEKMKQKGWKKTKNNKKKSWMKKA
jgi:hypothetical protein